MGGLGRFRGGGCGCCLVGLVGVSLVYLFIFFVVGCDSGGGGGGGGGGGCGLIFFSLFYLSLSAFFSF